MDIYLAILFVVNGELSIIDGWHPIIQPNIEACETRQEFLDTQIEFFDDLPEHVILCGTHDEIQAFILSEGV